MSATRISSITAILLLLAGQSSAFSLANFTPKIQNLPPTCNTAYTSPIPNCSSSDFGPSNDCSKECVEGLIQTSNAINAACKGVDVPETSVVGVFLLGQGIQALCNVQVATISSRTSAAATTTSQPARQQTQTENRSSTTRTDDDDNDDDRTSTATSTPASSTSTVPTTTPTPSSSRTLVVDPSPSMSFSTVRPTARPSQTSSPDSQQANADSGGGSPFDAQTGSASMPRIQDVWSLVLGTVALGVGMLWI